MDTEMTEYTERPGCGSRPVVKNSFPEIEQGVPRIPQHDPQLTGFVRELMQKLTHCGYLEFRDQAELHTAVEQLIRDQHITVSL